MKTIFKANDVMDDETYVESCKLVAGDTVFLEDGLARIVTNVTYARLHSALMVQVVFLSNPVPIIYTQEQ